jgi:hypothetical protein
MVNSLAQYVGSEDAEFAASDFADHFDDWKDLLDWELTEPEKQIDLSHRLYHALQQNHQLVETVAGELCDEGVEILNDCATAGLSVHSAVHDKLLDLEAVKRLHGQVHDLFWKTPIRTIAGAMRFIIGEVADTKRHLDAGMADFADELTAHARAVAAANPEMQAAMKADETAYSERQERLKTEAAKTKAKAAGE